MRRQPRARAHMRSHAASPPLSTLQLFSSGTTSFCRCDAITTRRTSWRMSLDIKDCIGAHSATTCRGRSRDRMQRSDLFAHQHLQNTFSKCSYRRGRRRTRVSCRSAMVAMRIFAFERGLEILHEARIRHLMKRFVCANNPWTDCRIRYEAFGSKCRRGTAFSPQVLSHFRSVAIP
jgi:hypothetical protein